jgi:spore coat polysaccharide biosynthesis protein SpsF
VGAPQLKLGIVIQARMGSTRLPGKILAPIAGRPLLDHILGRLAGFRKPAHIVIATSDSTRDDVVQNFCEQRNVDCFRGSEADVLARYYECARARGFDDIIRLTGDNPFPDVEELERLVELHISGAHDLSTSFEELPVGVGAVVFGFAGLERSHLYATAAQHREHVDEYILENRGSFRTARLSVPEQKRHPEVRLTVDTDEDLRRARFIAERAKGPWATTVEAVELCSRFA